MYPIINRACIFTLIILFESTITFALDTDNFNSENLEKYIEFRADHGKYSGITTIYHGEEKVFESIHGVANRTWDVSVDLHTKFNLASVTKMFTATAIGILIQEGKIDPNVSFITYFEDFTKPEIAKNTTINELLSHTSGISDFFFQDDYLYSDRSRLRSLEDYDRFYSNLTVADVPDDRILYSNTNYVILGRIIEKVTGMTYYDYLRRNIFEKAGMENTGFFEADLIIKNVATGYTIDFQASAEFGVPNDGALRSNQFMRAIKGMPAGGAYSTSRDLFLFMQALRNGDLITKEQFEKMTAMHRGGYGFGFQKYTQNGIEVIGHSGGFYGVSAMVFYLPEKDYTFISLANVDFGAQPVFDRFINNLAGLNSPEPINLDLEEFEKYEGFYEIESGIRAGKQVEIKSQEDRLLFDNALEFFPIGVRQFFDIDNDRFTITFHVDSSGEVIGFTRTDGRNFTQKATLIDASEVKILQPLTVSEEVLEQYLGNYQFTDDGMMPGHQPTITVENDGLMIDNMMYFLPFEKDKFFLEDDVGMQLHFKRNGSGVIEEIHVMQGDDLVGRVEKLD